MPKGRPSIFGVSVRRQTDRERERENSQKGGAPRLVPVMSEPNLGFHSLTSDNSLLRLGKQFPTRSSEHMHFWMGCFV